VGNLLLESILAGKKLDDRGMQRVATQIATVLLQTFGFNGTVDLILIRHCPRSGKFRPATRPFPHSVILHSNQIAYACVLERAK
jgi:hypothetical protein